MTHHLHLHHVTTRERTCRLGDTTLRVELFLCTSGAGSITTPTAECLVIEELVRGQECSLTTIAVAIVSKHLVSEVLVDSATAPTTGRADLWVFATALDIVTTPVEHVCNHPTATLDATTPDTTERSIGRIVELEDLLFATVTLNMEEVAETVTRNQCIVRRLYQRLQQTCSLSIVTSKESSLTTNELSKALCYAPSTFLIGLAFTVGKIINSLFTILHAEVEDSLLRLSICRLLGCDQVVNQWWTIIYLCSQHVSPCTHNLSLSYCLLLHRRISKITIKIVDNEVCRVDSLIDVVIKRTDRTRARVITELVEDTEVGVVIDITTCREYIVGSVVQTHDIGVPDTLSTTDLTYICSIHSGNSRLCISISLIEVTSAAGCFLLNIKFVVA